MERKKRVVFTFVEAGYGHIMPMRAIADAFEQKYGGLTEIIRTDFYKDTGDPGMKSLEDEFRDEVILSNKKVMRRKFHFMLLRFFGPRISSKFLMEYRWGRGYKQSLAYIKALDPDLIVCTFFSVLYACAEARKKGFTKAKIAAYCPDPVLGLQWDARADLMGISSARGRQKALNTRYFRKTRIEDMPFLIRGEVKQYGRDKKKYRRELNLPEDNFTIFLADGAYGAAKLRDTVLELLKSPQKMTIAAVCGKNEKLYKEFLSIKPPSHIHFAPYGFTDKTIMIAAACDLFIGKAGASALAEPIYFGAPAIVTLLASPIEEWICAHYVHSGCALKILNVKKAAALARQWAENPALMAPYVRECQKHMRHDGPEIFADMLWKLINNEG